MRWVLLGATDVPAHPKSGITERQTGALRSDGCLPAHLTARDGDTWRTLPAECTHISNSIRLSQQRNSHCQSGSPIYANRRKSANINTHSQSRRYLPTFTSRFHTCLYSWCITFAVCVRVCAFAIHSAVLYFYYDVRLTKNLFDGGSAISLRATVSIKPKQWPDFETHDL